MTGTMFKLLTGALVALAVLNPFCCCGGLGGAEAASDPVPLAGYCCHAAAERPGGEAPVRNGGRNGEDQDLPGCPCSSHPSQSMLAADGGFKLPAVSESELPLWPVPGPCEPGVASPPAAVVMKQSAMPWIASGSGVLQGPSPAEICLFLL
jgi:hypothetical protein